MAIQQFWTGNGHRYVLAIVCWLSIVIVVSDIVLPEEWKHWVSSHAPLLTLLLLSLFILAYLEHARLRPRLTNAADLGVRDMYRSRMDEDQIRAYANLMNHAKQELFIVGITLKDLSREQGDALRKRAAEGCRIELLMLSPEFRENKDPILDPVAFAAGPQVLRNNFCTAISNIRVLARSVRDRNRQTKGNGRLTVRFYTTAPTVSLTVRDGETSRGRMHVEVVPHQIEEAPFRPILDIEKVREAGIFDEFYQRYRKLWDESTTYVEVGPDKQGGMETNPGIDELLKGWLDLPVTWEDYTPKKAIKP